jgi:energy-coupling factor transporter ATP-binding protein EcfA2
MCFALGWNEKHCLPPLPEKEVERTVDSVHKTHGNNHPMSLNTDGIRKWIMAIPGQFRVADMDAELGIKDKDDKLQRTVILEDLCKEGMIERVGQARGVYRIRDRKMNVLSIDACEEPEVDLWLPFGLNRNVKVQQKNIIIVAGETNAGKTSLLMNMAWMQAKESNSRYLCSEMTGPELKSKTISFGHMDRWQRVEFVERTQGFHDVILPHGATYIDYLEVYDNFFRIGEEIRAIYDALKTGVVVIALQKATGADLGRGGAFTIEKARLALSLFSHGKMLDGIIGSAKVVKAKNIRPGFNPEGREIFYTLRNGYYFDAGDLPRSITDLQTGWRFYDKKTRERICQRIESHCREREVNEEMQNVEFYG